MGKLFFFPKFFLLVKLSVSSEADGQQIQPVLAAAPPRSIARLVLADYSVSTALDGADDSISEIRTFKNTGDSEHIALLFQPEDQFANPNFD